MKKIVLILSLLLFLSEVFASNYLLKPTGSYGIGFQDIRLVEGIFKNGYYFCPGHTDLLYAPQYQQDYGKDNQENFCREIMLRVYYPIHSDPQSSIEKYYPPAINDLQQMITAAQVPGVTPDDIQVLSQINSFSWKGKPLFPRRFPVILFDPGSGVEAEQYENSITELVSQGYIVLAINNTFVGSSILFPDGRLVHNRPDLNSIVPIADRAVFNDILFVRYLLTEKNSALAAFFPHMNLWAIGLMGHSMGGISVIAIARQYPFLFQAALSLDAPPTKLGYRVYSPDELAGFKIPVMRLFAAEWRTIGGIITPQDAQFQLLKHNYYVLLSPSEANNKYTGHMSLSDLSTLQYATAIQLYLNYTDPSLVGYADGQHIAAVTNIYMTQFFDRYLKDIPSPNLQYCMSLSLDSMLHCHGK